MGASDRGHPSACAAGNASREQKADKVGFRRKVRRRRIADVADHGTGRINWADIGHSPNRRNEVLAGVQGPRKG